MNRRVKTVALVVVIIVIIFAIALTRAPAQPSAGLSQTYQNGTERFSLQYPSGFTLDETYHYQELGPGKDIAGVKFSIPASMMAGTNLGSDTYMSVEEISQIQNCTAVLFLESGAPVQTITDGSATYSVAFSTGAAAGNRYEEWVYALPGTNPCMAVRYFIHYGVFENYPAGAVKEFDKEEILKLFDAIRRTLVIT